MPAQESSSGHRWARAEKLDAQQVAATLFDQTGLRLDVVGPCPGGQVGASYVRWPDGRPAVLTWQPDVTLAKMRQGPLAVVAALRAAGYPAPATELAVQVGRSVVLVQQLLPGARIDYLDRAGLDQALALNRLHAGRLAGRTDVPLMDLYLRSDGGGYCLHEPLRQFSRRSAALERWIRTVGADHGDRLVGDDAVHCDFHPGNMLTSDGVLTGVVDWDGAARGDCRLDLVTLRFGVLPGQCDEAVIGRLDAILDGMPAAVLRPAWAHMSLRMTDWAIRHFPAAEVGYWLDLAEQRIS